MFLKHLEITLLHPHLWENSATKLVPGVKNLGDCCYRGLVGPKAIVPLEKL